MAAVLFPKTLRVTCLTLRVALLTGEEALLNAFLIAATFLAALS